MTYAALTNLIYYKCDITIALKLFILMRILKKDVVIKTRWQLVNQLPPKHFSILILLGNGQVYFQTLGLLGFYSKRLGEKEKMPWRHQITQ